MDQRDDLIYGPLTVEDSRKGFTDIVKERLRPVATNFTDWAYTDPDLDSAQEYLDDQLGVMRLEPKEVGYESSNIDIGVFPWEKSLVVSLPEEPDLHRWGDLLGEAKDIDYEVEDNILEVQNFPTEYEHTPFNNDEVNLRFYRDRLQGIGGHNDFSYPKAVDESGNPNPRLEAVNIYQNQ